MKTNKLVLLSLLIPLLVRADEAPLPPPPPNPFSNLPSTGSEGFTPFDDDFDDGSNTFGDSTSGPSRNAGGGAKEKDRGGSPRAGDKGGDKPSAAGGFSGPKGMSKFAPPASCKEVVEKFDYPDVEILDVAKAIGNLTGKNFIYNPQDIKGRISIVSQTEITVCDAWNAFLTALNLKGFALVPSGKYLRIERIPNAKEKQTPIYSEKKAPNNDEFITRVIPLRYIDATEFESSFRLWMPREARMQAYAQTNTIIITDTAVHINRMVELINLLDVAGYQESLVVVPIRNAAAKDVASLIDKILNEGRSSGGGGGGGFGMQPRPANPYGSPSGGRSSNKGRAGGSSISRIIADERTNSIIVKANAAGILEIRALVRRLDTKVPVAEGSGRIHVIPLRFASAEDLQKTLSAITGGGSGANSRGNRGFPSFGEAAPVFQSEIKVAADKTTQSLVITASPADFTALRKVVDNLDQPRDQVFIEAMILEMSLNRDSAFGTAFVAASNGVALNDSGNLQTLLTGGLPSGFVLGFKQGPAKAPVDIGNGQHANFNDLNGLFSLIQSNTDSQLIASPQIIALDNEKATFEVTETVPVPKVTVGNGGATQQSFDNDNAELKLEVTPQINKGSNFVKLDILQKLQNFDPSNVPKELQGKVFGKNTRSTTTKLFVHSDDTVVLSGMIRNSVTEIIKKVPILGDIPVLGWLFKNSSTTNRKTNLLVFITPHIIKQYDKIRKVLANKMDERDEYVKETQGSIDPFGREINKLKKSLPDLATIEPLPQSTQPDTPQSIQGPSVPSRDNEEDFYPPDNGFYDPYNGQVPLPPIEGVPPPSIDYPPPVVNPSDGGGFGQ